MCNRYRNDVRKQMDFEDYWKREEFSETRLRLLDGQWRQELFPKYEALVSRTGDDGKPMLDVMKWGFPRVMKGKSGAPLAPKAITNTRDDNVKSSFWKGALAKPEFRCIVPVTAFHEYTTAGDRWFARRDGHGFFFAGIWRAYEWAATKPRVKKPEDPTNLFESPIDAKKPTVTGPAPTRVFSFLTTGPNSVLEPVHDRMPMILSTPDQVQVWLNGTVAEAMELATPANDDLLEMHTAPPD